MMDKDSLIMMKKISSPLFNVILLLYSCLAMVIFYHYGLPSLKGEIPQQLYSDSVTYELAAKLGLEESAIEIGGNYFGPLLIINIFSGNRLAIHLFNLLIVLITLNIASRNLELNNSLLTTFILSSPLLFFSTLAINKEIFLLPYTVLLAIYLNRRTTLVFIGVLFFGFIVRWQLAIFSVLVWFLTSRLNPIADKRKTTLFWFVSVVSICYPFISSELFNAIEAISVEGAQDELGSNASGAYATMQEIQRSFGYIFVFIPKTFQLLVGPITRFDINLIQLDFWNNFIMMLQYAHNIILIAFVAMKKKFNIKNNYLFLMVIYSMFFALSPVFNMRYMFPIIFWAALWISSDDLKETLQSNIVSTSKKIQ